MATYSFVLERVNERPALFFYDCVANLKLVGNRGLALSLFLRAYPRIDDRPQQWSWNCIDPFAFSSWSVANGNVQLFIFFLHLFVLLFFSTFHRLTKTDPPFVSYQSFFRNRLARLTVCCAVNAPTDS